MYVAELLHPFRAVSLLLWESAYLQNLLYVSQPYEAHLDATQAENVNLAIGPTRNQALLTCRRKQKNWIFTLLESVDEALCE